ncbi:MAG TPA: aminotransferase class I/II-fold pyridoxal phosphate-dependent enzyme [Aquifex aeolicus]|nr:aminotransferase class I/II-fold pyridoxal phosphate-dependent enzyme [Aquifex aeolicus]
MELHRADKLSPFIVMDILSEAQKYDDVIHMEIGEPDLLPSPQVMENLEKAVKERKFFYTPALGLVELREKIAEFYYKKYGVEVSPERIAITPGTSGAFLVAYTITLNAKDRIILPDPSYPCYKNFARILDIEPVFVNVDKSTNYEVRKEMIEEIEAKALHISSPQNPTGTLYSEKTLKELAQYCEDKGIFLISDEIYHGLVYEGKEHTALEFSDKAIVINGFSKYFCMPGFRIGWIILPSELVRKAEIVIQNIFISAPTLSQYAALGAFDYEYLEKVRKTFEERRNFLYSSLKNLFTIDAKPDGAFYIWADISKYSKDSYKFAMEVLKKAKVAITPGIDFGKNKTKKYVRFAYTRSIENLEEGIERIKKFLEKIS